MMRFPFVLSSLGFSDDPTKVYLPRPKEKLPAKEIVGLQKDNALKTGNVAAAQKTESLSRVAFCAAFSSTVATLIGHPLDTLKVLRQQGKSWTSPILPVLFRGIVPVMWGTAFSNGLSFAVEHQTKCWLQAGRNDEAQYWIPYLAGGVAGAASALLITPIDSIKTLQQLDQYRHFSSFALLRRGLFEGSTFRALKATMARETIACTIYFGSERKIEDLLKKEERLEHYAAFLAGCTAGVLSWVITAPLDRVKTAQQSLTSVTASNKKQGSLAIAREIYKAGGVNGFFVGTGLMASRAAIYNGIVFQLIYLLKDRSQENRKSEGEVGSLVD